MPVLFIARDVEVASAFVTISIPTPDLSTTLACKYYLFLSSGSASYDRSFYLIETATETCSMERTPSLRKPD